MSSIPALNSVIGFNEIEWRPTDGWKVESDDKKVRGQIDAFTSLMPIQWGKTKAVAFYWTIKIRGSDLLP